MTIYVNVENNDQKWLFEIIETRELKQTYSSKCVCILNTSSCSFDLSKRDQMNQFYKWSNQIRQKLFKIRNIVAMI
jgi:hypothetical protein